MFVVTVHFDIHPPLIDDFLPLIRENARRSVEDEPGCRQFDVCVDPKARHRVFLYEVYDDADAFSDHQQSPHFAHFDGASRAMVAGKSVSILNRL